jgi:proliferating cell nuclear antigen
MKVIWDAGLVADVLDALNAIVSEARFHFLDELIRIWVIDPANVAGCYIDLRPSENERIKHYSVQEDGLTIGLNTVKMDDVMSYADSDVPVQWEFGMKHNWAFNITLPGVDVDLAGIDPESIRQEPDHPGLEDELPAAYIVDGSSLDDAVNLNDMFSDHTTLAVEDHQVQFVASGDTDSGTYSLDEGDGEVEFTRHPDERVESMFSLDYLADFRKVLKGYDEVQMYSGQDFPVMFKTDLFDYMLAPRIDSTK